MNSPTASARTNRTVSLLFLTLPVLRLAIGAPFEPDGSTRLLLHLDGDTKDAAGKNYANAKGELEWQNGQFGKSVSMSGKGGVFTAPSTSLHIGEQSWTMECWIKPDKERFNHAPILTGGYSHGRLFGMRMSGKFLYVYFRADPLHGAQSQSEAIRDKLADGQWHHVAGVLDRSRNGEIRIYVDGKDVTASTGYMPYTIRDENRKFSVCVGATAPWYIGKDGYHGLVDEVRMSNIVRPEFAAPRGAPAPAPIPVDPIPAAASLTPDDPSSIAPLTLTPEQTVLIVPEHSPFQSDYEAANFLQKYLREMYQTETGFDRIARSSDAGDNTVLAVGRSAWVTDDDLKGLEKDGFIIKRKGRIILLAGRVPQASLYATAHFLDHFCGVRFYMPGKLFTSTPKRGKLVMEKLDMRKEPNVEISSSSGYHSSRDAGKWRMVNGIDRSFVSHQHSMHQRFPQDRFAEKRPEIYPFLAGKRYIPEGRHDNKWQPCFSEPKLVDAAVESANSYFTEHPDWSFIAFSVQDSHSFCECERCAKGVEQVGKWKSHSQLYWKFMNDVANRLEKQYPDKEIVGIAYSDVRHPPKFPLHRNVVPWLVFKISDARIDRRLEPGGEYNILEQWSKLTRRIGHHDWAQGNGFYIPRIYSSMVASIYGQARDLDLRIQYMHAEGYPNWGLDGPKLYIMSRIWWEPDQDVTELLRQFCDDMFGPAADEMFDYFTTLEALFLELNDDQERKLSRWHTQFKTDPSERAKIARARQLLNAAAESANTREQKQRIDLFSKTFRLSETLFEFAASRKISQAALAELKTYVREVIMPDPMTVYRRGKPDYIMEQIERVLAVLTKGKLK